MIGYLDLIRHVLTRGSRVTTRARLASTGTPVEALSVLDAPEFRHDLGGGFPLLTTKRVGLKGPLEELLWMLRGSTNSRELEARGVTIWREWAAPDGDLGPIYGRQWRAFGGHDHKTGEAAPVDQVADLRAGILAVKADPGCPLARRLILTAWNPSQLDAMALPPCHYAAQFFVRSGRLSCLMHMRSADLFLGVPYNIAGYALLTHILAHSCGLDVGLLRITFGDLHLYENHIGQAREQLARPARPLPALEIVGPAHADPRDYTPGHFALVNYRPYPALPGEVAI